VEEVFEIERRKLNLVIYGIPKTDTDQDMDQIAEILTTRLHMNCERHVKKAMGVGELDKSKPGLIRLARNRSFPGQRIYEMLMTTKRCSSCLIS